MEKLEHIGIAVKNIDQSNPLFAALLGQEHYKVESVESEGVRTSFFKIGDVKIELLEPTRPDSPIARFIEKKGRESIILRFLYPTFQKVSNLIKIRDFSSLTTNPNAVRTTN